jgi:hypothetical protein
MDTPEGTAMKAIRTDDLALATTLRIRGFEPDKLELEGKKALWVFTGDGELHSTIRKYNAGEETVEPRRYNKVLRETRQSLFRFLTANGLPPRANPNS